MSGQLSHRSCQGGSATVWQRFGLFRLDRRYALNGLVDFPDLHKLPNSINDRASDRIERSNPNKRLHPNIKQSRLE